MTIALVSQGAVAASYTPAFGQATTAGNLLLAWTTTTSNASTFSTTTSATGWTLVKSGGGAFDWVGLWARPGCGAGETAPTFTDPDPNGLFSMLAEFSGAATSSPVDQSGAIAGGTVSCSAPDTAASELLANVGRWDGGTGGPVTITVTATDTNSTNVSLTLTSNESSVGTQFYFWAWGITGATLGSAEDSASNTISEFENSSAQVIASFKNAPAKKDGKFASSPLGALIAAGIIH
jgi:hypothetical protein